MSTPSEAAPVEDAKPRLLLVDDVFDNRAVLGRRFERRGYEVVEADCGARALELIAQETFDLVLLDVMMPDLDGREVLRRIRVTHSSLELPVIMVTAKSQSEDVVEALTLGAQDYITKPVDFAVALARVHVQVGRKQAEEQVRLANAALSRANEELEARVAARTAELVDANGRLQLAVEKAEAANRSKDAFLANMSHELRTPLNGVIGMAQVLTATPLTASQAEMVGLINSSAEGLQHILSDLLDMVDLASGKVALAREVTPLGVLVRDAAAASAVQARQKGLAFRIALSPDAEAPAELDPGRLRQVLENLLSNAVKFTERGQVALTVSRSPAGGALTIFEVSDTGVGFDPATAERLFEPFEQEDVSSTRRFGGMGLGLSICRELVAQMGGVISAHGRPGEGATFRVELPLPLAGGAVGAGANAAPSLHVLCVEDQAVNRQVLEHLMRMAGVRLTAATDGAQAVEAFKAGRFDAVLMDIQMPVMDGLAATREMRAFEAATSRPRTPIVMVTAYGLPEHLAASRAAGADRHLTKPVDAKRLLSTLEEVAADWAAPPLALSA